MKPETLSALKESIRHWEHLQAIDNITDAKTGSSKCALCGLFNTQEMTLQESCVGCPVNDETGIMFCDGTPFEAAVDAKDESDIIAFKAAAREEVAFLRSLLQDGETE